MNKNIRVMTVPTSGEVNVIERWECSLDSLQKFVGGWLEAIRVTDEMVIWINEEGKLENLDPNFMLCNGIHNPYDNVVGNAIITGCDSEGETTSLTLRQVEEVKERFITRRLFDIS